MPRGTPRIGFRFSGGLDSVVAGCRLPCPLLHSKTQSRETGVIFSLTSSSPRWTVMPVSAPIFSASIA